MLNLSVTATSLRAGQRAAYWYVVGIVTVFLVQAGLATIGVNYLRANPDIVELLSWWAVPVLTFLAAFLLLKHFRQPPEDEPDEEKQDGNLRHPYVQGLSVSLMNLVAISYFFTVGSWLILERVLSPSVGSKVAFVGGAVAGAAAILSGYVRGAKWVDAHAHYVTRHIHLLVAVVLGALAGVG